MSLWMKITPCIIALLLVAGCGRSVQDRASPDAVIAAYQKYSVKANVEGLWSLFGDQHRARFPGGMDDLRGLATRRVQSVTVRANKTIDANMAVYYVTTMYADDDPVEKGGSIRSRVLIRRQKEQWRIARIGPDIE